MTRNKTMPPPTVTARPKVLVSLITALMATIKNNFIIIIIITVAYG